MARTPPVDEPQRPGSRPSPRGGGALRAGLVTALLRLFAALPLRWNRRLGAALGRLMVWVPNRQRRHSAINLRLCLPALSEAERRRLLRDSLIETGKTVLEAGPIWLWPADRLRGLLGEAEGAEAVDAALKAGRGLIMATPHLGCWEMAGQYCAARWGITSLYRPPRLAALDGLIRQGRERLGARLVPTDARGVRQLYETLARGGMIGILPDQDPGRGGVFAPFFGIPANSMVLIGRLAHKTGAPVFFCFSERLPGADGYRMHFFPAPADIAAADPVLAASAMNQGIETCVRACPSQYQWSYRRFRNRPPGQAPIY
ncbi:MAG: lysophospholipid acyltransferase family protein [Gammaproteobacteria bacterium]